MKPPAWADRLSWIFVGMVIGVAGTLLSNLLMTWLSLGEANLVYVGSSRPPAPDMTGGIKDGKLALHIKIRPVIMNKGFKPGHVDRIEVSPAGLTPPPERVDVTFLDRSPLRWRETREIRVEFLAV